jgi:hypothetical protein
MPGWGETGSPEDEFWLFSYIPTYKYTCELVSTRATLPSAQVSRYSNIHEGEREKKNTKKD